VDVELTRAQKGDKMKVVINRCPGGFGLSRKAIHAYLKRKGKDCFFYTTDPEKRREGKSVFIRASDEEGSIYGYTLTKDYGDVVAGKEQNFKQKDFFRDNQISRDDPDLIAVVEELGKDANGECAKLKIIEIPDGIEWEIGEFNGDESVEETHRSWR